MTSKKPLFKRPAWAASGTGTAPATTTSAANDELDAIYQQPPVKKRRVSNDAEDQEKYKGHKRRSTPGSDEAAQYHNHIPSSRSPSHKDKPGTVLINLEDDDDDHVSQGVVCATAESELKAKAREEQRLEKLGTEPSPDPGAGLPPITAPLSPSVEEKEVAAPVASDRKDRPPLPPPPTDPAPNEAEVTIYINPLIPNTKALIVGRKASQPLEPVKTFWCKKQNLSDAEAAKVFFIWRDMKLFNSSTMQHIVARLQKERKPNQKDPEGRIVLEAVTQELYELRKAELAAKKEAGGSLSSFSSSFSGGSGVGKLRIEGGREAEAGKQGQGATAYSEANPPATADNKFIIRLVSKEYGEMAILIRPESTVGKIAAGFVQKMVAPPGGDVATTKVAYLIFDGDRLEKEQTADEVGLEEGDVVEVQRVKISHDPRNLHWLSAGSDTTTNGGSSGTTTSFGKRLMQRQGWQQGQALGSRPANAPSDLDAQRLAAAKVGVIVKDDTLGLGAQLRSKDVAHQKTGLDAFQGLLGRLNARDQAELEAVERKEDDRKLEMYAKGRWGGGVVFVRGGLLVPHQEDLVSAGAEQAASPSLPHPPKKQVVPLSNGRHLLRGRNIEAKRKAFSDAKGLDAIFMKTTATTS
ncbi:hypothetical protein DV738_g4012, partial [Chaetothyriales sp. CBS 135597]